MKTSKTISLRASPEIQKFLLQLGETSGGGSEFGLEALHELFQSEIRGLVGKFSAPELSAMIDISNSLLLAPRFLGEHFGADLEDGARLDGLAEKWGYDSPALLEKWASLPRFSRAALEIWAKSFWRGENDLEKYVGAMASKIS